VRTRLLSLSVRWVACLFALACFAQSRVPSAPDLDQLTPEQGQAFLAGFRHSRLNGDLCLRFEIIHKPRKGDSLPPVQGTLWASTQGETHLLRGEIKDAQGKPVKSEYGAWVLTAMSVLAKFKFLRGSLLDPFGWTQERKLERQLLAEYQVLVQRVIPVLNADNHSQWLQVLSLPQQIRGFGYVKLASIEHYRRQLAQALPEQQPEAQTLAMAA
jgi:hypothetical protein